MNNFKNFVSKNIKNLTFSVNLPILIIDLKF